MSRSPYSCRDNRDQMDVSHRPTEAIEQQVAKRRNNRWDENTQLFFTPSK